MDDCQTNTTNASTPTHTRTRKPFVVSSVNVGNVGRAGGGLFSCNGVAVSRALGSLLVPTLGPNGRDKLVMRASGKGVLVSNHGATLLRCVSSSHPVGEMIISSALRLASCYGDGSSRFVIMLSKALATLETDAPDATVCSKSAASAILAARR